MFLAYQGDSIVVRSPEFMGFETPEPFLEIVGTESTPVRNDIFSGEGFNIPRPAPPIGKRRHLAGRFVFGLAADARTAGKKSNNQWIRQRLFEGVSTRTGDETKAVKKLTEERNPSS